MSKELSFSLESLLSISFRPFFLLAAIIAFVNPALWIFHYLGHISLSMNTSVSFWHGHEMIFAFSGALIAGFILTASANWTSSTPYSGKSLVFLITLWGIGRVSYLLPVSDILNVILLNLFFPALTIMLFFKLKKFPKQRNVFIPLLSLISMGAILHSYGNIFDDALLEISGRDIAVGLIRFIILLIGGRVLPFFTRKRLPEIQIDIPGWANPLALVPIVILAIPLPEATPKILLSFIYAWAIAANFYRFVKWKPLQSAKVPILVILNIGIIFILLGLVQELVGLYYTEVLFSKAALHMMMTSGLGIVGLGIMTRVSLGHTGRPIVADLWIKLVYVFVVLAALIRSIVPVAFGDFYITSLYVACTFWCIAFLIFFFSMFGILTSPRPK